MNLMTSRQLVFLHGFLGSPAEAAWWRLRMPDWQVTVPELGITDHWDAELERLAEQLPCPAVLGGYSQGARLALGLAIRYPQRWQGLVAISGSPGLATAAERDGRRKQDTKWCERLQGQPVDDFLESWYQQPVFAHDPAECIAMLISEKRSLDRQGAARALRILSVANQPDYRTDLPNLQIPVLLLAGERDATYVSLAREMARWLPMADLHVVAGAGHALHRSHPANAFRAIMDFLECRAVRVDHGTVENHCSTVSPFSRSG